jgi:hypothetical protein
MKIGESIGRLISWECEVPRASDLTMEITVRKKILTVLVVPLIAALTAQAAAAEHRHMRTKDRAVAIERFRNSNAYAAPRGNIAVRSYLRDEDEAAMTSGLAGH